MATGKIPFALPGFKVCSTKQLPDRIIVTARSTSPSATCPNCLTSSFRIHSYYTRKPRDLPVSELPVALSLRVRRFRCQNAKCDKKTFAESFPGFLYFRSRSTRRLSSALRHICFFLGGRAGARLAHKLSMPGSHYTLLRHRSSNSG